MSEGENIEEKLSAEFYNGTKVQDNRNEFQKIRNCNGMKEELRGRVPINHKINISAYSETV